MSRWPHDVIAHCYIFLPWSIVASVCVRVCSAWRSHGFVFIDKNVLFATESNACDHGQPNVVIRSNGMHAIRRALASIVARGRRSSLLLWVPVSTAPDFEEDVVIHQLATSIPFVESTVRIHFERTVSPNAFTILVDAIVLRPVLDSVDLCVRTSSKIRCIIDWRRFLWHDLGRKGIRDQVSFEKKETWESKRRYISIASVHFDDP